VCVKNCPSEYFVFDANSPSTDWQNKMICKDGVRPKDETEAKDMIANNICARYYLKSKEGESAVCTFSVRSFNKLR
jgi:hypothetical protein